MYSILSVLQPDDVIEYDLTDVIDGGWVDEDEAKDINYEKIIVLTEGRTDVEFISKSIDKLYPYLHNYYHFIDFQEYKIESNASALVRMVRSFAAVNIKHPIIVLFDNDTIGRMEMGNIESSKLPPNIKILCYPDIPLAKKYPTVGVMGKKCMNVNKLACSIEMYVGSEILTRDDHLIPIRWKSYNEKANKYQGEISAKDYVQNKFREKLRGCVDHSYFKDIEAILNIMFNAFSD